MGLTGVQQMNSGQDGLLQKNKIVIIGITGATGSIYGVRLLEVLSGIDNVETHLIISDAGAMTIEYELDRGINEVKKLASCWHDIRDISSGPASGSFKADGMVIAPCSIKTMSALANSYNDNLLIRAGDVCLKERRKLVLLVRETPLHLGHLRSMESLCQMGATILPPVPAFYHRPKTIMDIVDHTVGRVLDTFGIEHNLFPRWSGMHNQE
jgi:4-hydroxy-3-polyprenylbenzoate decarboxylase